MVSFAMPSFSHRCNSVNMADANARSAPALVAAASLAAEDRADVSQAHILSLMQTAELTMQKARVASGR